jgi:hypothetical protein
LIANIIPKKYVILTLLLIFLCICTLVIINYHTGKSNFQSETAGQPNEPDYFIFIEVEDNTLYLFQDGICIKKYPISSGAPGYPSPIGYWRIVNKGDWGEGFGGRWMGLNVPWGKYGIHGTEEEYAIGQSASHGCIRMYKNHVKELYEVIPIGTPVTIVNGRFGPFGTGFKAIEVGDRGADVYAIQERLISLGYLKSPPTGIYEDDLKYALHRFQKENGLKVKNTITKEDFLKMGFREFE